MSDEPKGVKFLDKASGRILLLVQDAQSDFDGWLAYNHPDGQWVTLRKATEEDKQIIEKAWLR